MAQASVSRPTVSIIMPIYNEAEYLPFALESVLMQQTDFPIEVLVVDDCSTDETAVVAEHYRMRAPHIIRYFRNPQNLGNAYAFWHGLSEAKGDFFHVLDGDDFFLLPDKLQRQVDFLRNNPSYSAVATNSLRLLPNGRFYTEMEAGRGDRDYTYQQVLSCDFYLHTSAYMYRNVFKGEVPSFLKEEWARGDSIRTILVAKHGPVRYLDCIASVYRFHNSGIWSSMSEAQRQERVARVFTIIRDRLLESEEEKKLLNIVIRNSSDLANRSRIKVLLALCLSPRRLLHKIRQPGLKRRFQRLLTGQLETMTIRDMLASLAKPHFSKWGQEWYHRLPKHDLCTAMGMLHLSSLGCKGTFNAPFKKQLLVLLGQNAEKFRGSRFEGWQVIVYPDAETPPVNDPVARMEYLLSCLHTARPEHIIASVDQEDIGLMASAQSCMSENIENTLATNITTVATSDKPVEKI